MHLSPIPRRDILAGLAASVVVGRAAARQTQAAATGWETLELLDTEDRVFRITRTERRWTLLLLWAHWCPVCLDELEGLQAATSSLAGRDVAVVLVSSPHDWAEDGRVAEARAPGIRRVRPSARNAASTLRATLFDDEGWFYVPRSIFYDRDKNEVVWSHLGRTDWASATWLARAGAPAGV